MYMIFAYLKVAKHYYVYLIWYMTINNVHDEIYIHVFIFTDILYMYKHILYIKIHVYNLRQRSGGNSHTYIIKSSLPELNITGLNWILAVETCSGWQRVLILYY